MDLDDVKKFKKLDTQDMLGYIADLPNQLGRAWRSGLGQPLPSWDGFRYILIAGMGGSAIAGDMLSAYIAARCSVPVIIHRDYDLPAWARGPETLIITSSHSGNTEETLTAFETARKNGCRILSITTGGKLAEMSRENDVPCWIFEHKGQPRSAVGFSFGLMLSALTRLALTPNPAQDVSETVAAMQAQQEQIRADVPVAKNPAKRLAGQLCGRLVAVVGAGVLAPVARRWKGQLNELAKSWAQFDTLPEADHNTLAGLSNPENVLTSLMTLFLRCPSDHPRTAMRFDLTRQAFVVEGINTDTYEAQGKSSLAHIWTALHFGDYVAYYLAMTYGANPTKIPSIDTLKEGLQKDGA